MNKKDRMNENKSKKSQITVFVIIALLIIIAIALIFIFTRQPAKIDAQKPDTIRVESIRDCSQKAISDYTRAYFYMGGLNTAGRYFRYNGTSILFLCYSSGINEVCQNEHPAFAGEIESKIKAYLEPRLRTCFSNINEQFSKYDYKESALSLNVSILPEVILIEIGKEISYLNKGSSIKINNFNVRVKNNLFDLIRFATEISNQEVTGCDCTSSCDANLVKLNRENQDFLFLKPYYASSGEEVYSVTHKISGEQLNFVVRNCVS